MKKLVLGVLVCVSAACAQSNWYGAGGAYNTTSPQGVGWASYAHAIRPSIWEFNLYCAYVVKGKIVTATSAGGFIPIRALGPINIYAFGTVGVAATAGNAGNTFPWGGFGDYTIGKTLWHLDAGYMQVPSSLPGVQTQKIVLLGAGRTF